MKCARLHRIEGAPLLLCPKFYTVLIKSLSHIRVYILLHLLEHVCVELSVFSFDKLSVVSRVAIKSLFLVALLVALCLVV